MTASRAIATVCFIISITIKKPMPRRKSKMSVITVTKENFTDEVINSDKPVLLDFWAGWCGPCMMMSPVVDEVAEENPDIKTGKINVDEQPELAQSFGVESIPMLAYIKDGKLADYSIGYVPKENVLKLIGK